MRIYIEEYLSWLKQKAHPKGKQKWVLVQKWALEQREEKQPQLKVQKVLN